MICRICNQEQKVDYYDHDEAVLCCGHLQTDDPELSSVESVVYESEIKIRDLMSEHQISREDAQDMIIRESLADLPTKAIVITLRTLKQHGLECQTTKELGFPYRKYLKI